MKEYLLFISDGEYGCDVPVTGFVGSFDTLDAAKKHYTQGGIGDDDRECLYLHGGS